MESKTEKERFNSVLKRLKSEWQSLPTEVSSLSDKSRDVLFSKLKEIENERETFVPWELTARYIPRFSLASAAAAFLFVVTFQTIQSDLSLTDQQDIEYAALFAGDDQIDEPESVELLFDESEVETEEL